MIKWCAYCLRFIGLSEPYHDFQISHGVCARCETKVLTLTRQDVDQVQPIRAFFERIQARALAAQHLDTRALWQESLQLRIAPLDFMVGILQPLLQEIGNQWADGVIPVATEHRFSGVVRDLMALIRRTTPGSPRVPGLEVLLANVEGNRHTLGLEMNELLLAPYHRPIHTVLQGLPMAELLALIEARQPRAVGLSMALPGQLPYVLVLSSHLKRLPQPPEHLVVGGPALASGLNLAAFPGLTPCPLATDLPTLLGWPDPASPAGPLSLQGP